MAKYKAGLHKEVERIFNSVWIPQLENTPSSISTAYRNNGAFVHPKPLAPDNWPNKTKATQKIKNARKGKQSWAGPWSFLSPKARREKKRITTISRHLLINMPD